MHNKIEPLAPSFDYADEVGASFKSNWKAFQASVDELNAFVRPNVLRKYQFDILNTGKFSLISPISGISVEVTRSVLVGSHIAYLVGGPPDGWIVAGYEGKACPLHEFVSEVGYSRHKIAKVRTTEFRAFGRIDVANLLSGYRRNLDLPTDGRVTLIIGHKNFAHHLWNELTALDEWLEQSSAERRAMLSILTTAEPLGPLREIFATLSGVEIVPVTAEQLQHRVQSGGIAVRVGSRFVTRSIQRKVLAFSNVQAHAPPPLRLLLNTAWPRIWASVRIGSRTADNLEEFLLALFRKTFETYPDAMFILDGFSFPRGFLDDSRTIQDRELFVSYATSANEFIENLRSKAAILLGARKASRIQNISGISLPDAISLGSYCDYYVCHIGTLQHKVGWLHNIPGFLHGPNPRKKHAAWHAEQVEDGIVPAIVPKRLVVFSDAPASREGNWNLNYAFVDVERVANRVINSMQSSLKDPQSSDRRQASLLAHS